MRSSALRCQTPVSTRRSLIAGCLQGAEAYARNLEEAVSAGAFGAPFWITAEDERFWGQDRVADLDAHLAGTL